jgi:hypothetical protein
MHTVRRSSRLGAMAVIVAAAMALFGSVPAQASAWYSISGTVYDSQAYYLSSTVRTVNGSVVQVQLSTIPSRHIRWRLYSTNKGAYFAGPVEISNNSTYGIATGVISGRSSRTPTARAAAAASWAAATTSPAASTTDREAFAHGNEPAPAHRRSRLGRSHSMFIRAHRAARPERRASGSRVPGGNSDTQVAAGRGVPRQGV